MFCKNIQRKQLIDRLISLVVFLFSAFIISGCIHRPSLYEKPTKVTCQEDIGRCYATIISVAPFEKYKSDLMPKFDLKAKEALEKAISTTMIEQNSQSQAFGMQANLAYMAGISESDMSFSDVPDTAGSGKSEFKPMNEIPAAFDLKPKELGVNAMMQYWAATALYQEVKLLENYLDDIEAVGDDEELYVVRLQITLLPSSRNMPYDTIMDLNFFETKTEKEVKNESKIIPSSVKVYPLLVPCP